MATTSYPKAIYVYGYRLEAVGIGKYPYDCISKDNHPDAMIYESREGGWTHSMSHDFLVARDKSRDEW